MYRVRSLCGGMSKRCHPHGRRTAHTGCRGLRILRQMYQILSDGCKRSDRTGIYGKRTGKRADEGSDVLRGIRAEALRYPEEK